MVSQRSISTAIWDGAAASKRSARTANNSAGSAPHWESLSANSQRDKSLWFIPISVPLLGAWRSWENIAQVANIAKYIKEIEDALAADLRPIGPHKGRESYLV